MLFRDYMARKIKPKFDKLEISVSRSGSVDVRAHRGKCLVYHGLDESEIKSFCIGNGQIEIHGHKYIKREDTRKRDASRHLVYRPAK